MSSADFGAKASIPGNDITNQALAKELMAFTSANGAPKIQLGMNPAHFDVIEYKFGNMPSARQDLIVIEHGYGYTPLTFVQMGKKTNDSLTMLPLSVQGLGGGIYSQEISCEADNNNLTIYFDYSHFTPGTPNPNFPGDFYNTKDTFIFKYYIFAEDGL